ncbi:peptide/nickel transport system permease protein [Anaerotaenia torta]|uniref:ABC transporter permease n=1 Tax=Anaerotaenia torta TaxID=433293 RepID=UPI003D252DF7
MRKFLIKRLAISVIILFFIALIIYTVIRCMPTSYVEGMARQKATLPGGKSYSQWLAELEAAYGLDVGIVPGFIRWLGQAIQGKFGDSWAFNVPVTEKFSRVIWYSFMLGAASFILEIILAIPLGIMAARKQYSRADYAISVFALIGISLPSFFFATVLKWVFSIKLGWFDLFGMIDRMHEQMSPVGQAIDIAKHFVLPVLTLTIVSVGSLMRYTRTNMLEVLNSDYIRTARAKGLSERRVVNYHAFRNTLIPIVTILGASLPGLFGGAMITETLFQIEGIGYTSYKAMTTGDIPFSMFYMVFLAILTLIGNLIADVLYAVVDPRVRIN